MEEKDQLLALPSQKEGRFIQEIAVALKKQMAKRNKVKMGQRKKDGISVMSIALSMEIIFIIMQMLKIYSNLSLTVLF